MTNTEKTVAFKKAAEELVQKTIAEYRVLFPSIIIGVGTEATPAKQATKGAVQ